MKSLPRSTAKDVFSHLLAYGTLYVVAVAFITLFFQYINVKFPDALQYYYTGSLNGIRSSMASIIVVWPVFLLISWFINSELLEEKEKREIGIRKWLLYLTLFVTAVTIIVDLVTLVNYFLNGEVTTRFILKVLVVLVTAGAVFGYELWELRRDTHTSSRVPMIAGIATSVALVASVLLGFFLVGTPATQRLRRLDDQRVMSLTTIQSQVVSYYTRTRSIPLTLEDMNNPLDGFVSPVDPVTGGSYEYNVKGELTFELCATFSTNSILGEVARPTEPYYGYDPLYNKTWDHGTGRTCFERTIDPAFYPVMK